MSIEQEIASWDGKSSSDIDAIYSRHDNDVSFAAKLIDLFQQTALQKGATWLLKRHLEGNRKLEANEIAMVYRFLSRLEHWETKLHILQCIPFMPIAETEKKAVETFLRKCLIDSNKFIRAWAYNGFYEISTQYPEYKKETKQFFEMAMRDEAPSVKARIRNIVKKDF
ncbi:MAG: hypothetical protein CSA50_04460 [Gammaproteobacteria bacterium]|nr:MAG: hypothetical protein CSA50_04460 [Gammaproteobacteria bacterium]